MKKLLFVSLFLLSMTSGCWGMEKTTSKSTNISTSDDSSIERLREQLQKDLYQERVKASRKRCFRMVYILEKIALELTYICSFCTCSCFEYKRSLDKLEKLIRGVEIEDLQEVETKKK